MVHEVKIRNLAELTNYGGVLCHGCFDILHVGHIRHLLCARELAGEKSLIVTITADQYIRKGPGRPCFPAEVRAECVAALACVDYVAVVDEATGLTPIEIIRPRYYVKGSEYNGRGGIAQLEHDLVERMGGKVVFTENVASSTKILELLNGHRSSTRVD